MHSRNRRVHRPLVRLQYVVDRLAETYDDALALAKTPNIVDTKMFIETISDLTFQQTDK